MLAKNENGETIFPMQLVPSTHSAVAASLESTSIEIDSSRSTQQAELVTGFELTSQSDDDNDDVL